MPMFSNIDDVARWLDSVVADFTFDLPGDRGTIGEDSAHAIADGIQERSYVDQRGASEPWPENSERYRTEKDEKYGTTKTNYRTQQMLLDESLTANLISIDEGKTFVMQYGTGTAPTTSPTGHISDQDKLVTDTVKAAYAHEQGRPFFQLDKQIATERVMPVVSEGLGKYLQERADE